LSTRIRAGILRGFVVGLLIAAPLTVSGADDLFTVAKQKVDRIVTDNASPGETISLSTAEINALFQRSLQERKVEGVDGATIKFASDTGTWAGTVDFDKLPALQKYRNNFLLTNVLRGSAPVSATTSLVSASGQATIKVTEVTVGKTKFEGNTLGFLVKDIVLNEDPDIELGKPFDLKHNVESIKLAPQGIAIKISN
jgi:hypothetical protein